MTGTRLASVQARPRYFTPGVLVVLAVALIGTGSLLYRYIFGLGASTNLTDAHPWGIWIAIDVACGVALAAGGFTTAFIAHLLHRGQYHALVRPALLTAMIGYTFVAVGVMTDLGRFWAMWHVMLPEMWQPNSVLFEVAMCVMTYVTVLYIEFLPVVCERFVGRVRLPGVLARLNAPIDRALRLMDATLARVITVFVILGVVLSCMHQSSLGTLMVIAGPKLHELWQSPFLPLMFLLSAFSVGFPMVVFEATIAARSFRIEPETNVLSKLARITPFLLAAYLGVKVWDIVHRGVAWRLLEGSTQSVLFMVEVGLGVIAPLLILSSGRLRRNGRWLFVGATMVIFGVAMNRMNVFLLAYRPLEVGATYFPAWTEIAVTAGFIALMVLIYRAIVLNFPVIEALPTPGATAHAHASLGPVAAASRTHAPHAPRPHAELVCERGVTTPAALAVALVLSGGAILLGAGGEPDREPLPARTVSEPTPAPDPSGGSRVRAHPAPSGTRSAVPRGERGPDVVVIDSMADLYAGVTFDHRLHEDMAEMGDGCASCHHANDDGRIEACRTCHPIQRAEENEALPGLKGAYHRQCLGCHRDWSGANGCAFCHEEIASGVGATRAPVDFNLAHPHLRMKPTFAYETSHSPGPLVTFHHADHTDVFGLSCVDCHRGETCDGCHGPEAGKPIVDCRATCAGCHNERGCVFCHSVTPRPRFDHGRSTGWDLGEYHSFLSCDSCHEPDMRFGSPSSDVCRGCHRGSSRVPFDHAITGVALTGSHQHYECVTCHTGGRAGSPVQCVACHRDRSFPEFFPGANAGDGGVVGEAGHVAPAPAP